MFKKIKEVITTITGWTIITTACVVAAYETFFGAGFESVDSIIVALLIYWLSKK